MKLGRAIEKDKSTLLLSSNGQLNGQLGRLYHRCLQALSSRRNTDYKRTPSRSNPLNIKQIYRYLSSGNEESKKDAQDPKDEKKDPEEDRRLIITATLVSIFSWIVIYNMFKSSENKKISWQYFVNHLLPSGEIKSISVQPEANNAVIFLHPRAIIDGKLVNRPFYQLEILNSASFEEKLRKAERALGISPENSLPIRYERNLDSISFFLTIIIALLAIRFLPLLFKGMRTGKGGSPFDITNGLRSAKFTMIDPSLGQGKGVKFSDVAGLKEAKVEIMEFVAYLKNPTRYTGLGAKIPKGVLLLGPPGCGKTLLAKAVASEASVPFLAMAGSEFVEMIGGLGAARVRDLFAKARKRSPCIIYIDEIDAIGRKRSSGASNDEETSQTLNQLLVEMDGMAGREGVILLASTNRADILDKALLRPGRFDRHILIDYPTMSERFEIFIQHLKPIKLEKEPSVYASRLAQLTPGFSGADIANVCNEAALNAAKHKRKQVTEIDLEYAIERVVGGAEKKSTVISPDERKIIAYHESGHALVGWLLKHTDALLKVTIVPRTSAVLGFAMSFPTDRKLYSQEELFDKMCMALGGRVAESIIFNRVTTGAQNDLQKVTNMAYNQVKSFGMDPVIGPLSFSSSNESGEATKDFQVKPYSKKLGATIDTRVSILVGSAYKQTESVLLKNRDKLKTLAEALLERETLNYDDVVKLIGPPPFGEKKKVEVIDFGPMVEDDSRSNDPPQKESMPNDAANKND